MRILGYFTLATAAIGMLFSLYTYDRSYGFNETFNPAQIFMWIMALVGIAGIIGNFLTKLDIKKGYCNLGITDEQIRRYRKTHNIPDPYAKMQEIKNASDHETVC